MNKKINHSKIIKSLIKNTNFSNEELARYLGIALRTAQHWTSSNELRIPTKYWALLIKVDKNLTGRDLHGCNINEEEVNEGGYLEYIEDDSNEDGK